MRNLRSSNPTKSSAEEYSFRENWKKVTLIQSLLLFTLLASCSQASAPTSSPTQGTTAPIPTTATTTFTQSLTGSSAPSNTGEVTLTPRIFPTETADIHSEATYQALVTKIASLPGNCEPDYSTSNITLERFPVSPDGNWVLDPCLSTNLSLQVIRLDRTKTWIITREEIKNTFTWERKDDQVFYISPTHWTKDSRQVYFEVYICCTESNTGYGEHRGFLYRVDVITGNWGPVIGISESRMDDYSYAFSPTDRRLVYIEDVNLDQSLPIHIIDLKTGNQELVVVPKYHDGGRILWSPEGLSFAFGAFRMDVVQKTFTYSVFTYQIESKSLKNIFTSPSVMCTPKDWSVDSILTLSCSDQASDSQNRVAIYTQYYNVNTGSLMTPSPTP